MMKVRAWFNSLKVSQKLMLISVFFMMPDSFMLYMFITGINSNIEFARMEMRGSEYQRPLERLLDLIPQHLLLKQLAAAGDREAGDQMAGKQAEIDRAFDRLEEVNSHIGAELRFTDEALARRGRSNCRVELLRHEWDDLKHQAVELDRKASDDRHLRLVGTIRTMITHAGDMSNLILDPDLDSYYLMDVTLLALPQTQDRLATVMSDGQTFLSRPDAGDGTSSTLCAVNATLLKEMDLDRVASSTRTALNEDQNFYLISATLQSRVPSALLEYIDATKAFIDLTWQSNNTQGKRVSAAEYRLAGSRARSASFRLWTIADEELDVLLQRRIDSYLHSRERSLCVAAMAFLAAVTLVAFITRSISGPLKQQAHDLKSANQALVEQEVRLEHRVRERTRELQLEIRERTETQAQLQTTHKQLLVSSRQAGMAEVATGVLHNVGNVLNSVNVSSTLIGNSLRTLRIAGLGKIADLLGEHTHDMTAFMSADPRGKKLPAFLSQLAGHFAAEQSKLLGELNHLQKNVEHIKEIVNTQQAHASSAGLVEPVNLRELLEAALRLNIASLNRLEIDVVRAFQDVPLVLTDKHKILQILVNLITNAGHAMSGRPTRTLTLSIRSSNDQAVYISVSDTGCGIAANNMTRIFAHGFTTKADGHGFGLHCSALAAKEMKGSLTVHSDGPDRGAVFTLELPMPRLEMRAA